jgi:hypothetical protein
MAKKILVTLVSVLTAFSMFAQTSISNKKELLYYYPCLEQQLTTEVRNGKCVVTIDGKDFTLIINGVKAYWEINPTTPVCDLSNIESVPDCVANSSELKELNGQLQGFVYTFRWKDANYTLKNDGNYYIGVSPTPSGTWTCQENTGKVELITPINELNVACSAPTNQKILNKNSLYKFYPCLTNQVVGELENGRCVVEIGGENHNLLIINDIPVWESSPSSPVCGKDFAECVLGAVNLRSFAAKIVGNKLVFSNNGVKYTMDKDMGFVTNNNNKGYWEYDTTTGQINYYYSYIPSKKEEEIRYCISGNCTNGKGVWEKSNHRKDGSFVNGELNGEGIETLYDDKATQIIMRGVFGNGKLKSGIIDATRDGCKLTISCKNGIFNHPIFIVDNKKCFDYTSEDNHFFNLNLKKIEIIKSFLNSYNLNDNSVLNFLETIQSLMQKSDIVQWTFSGSYSGNGKSDVEYKNGDKISTSGVHKDGTLYDGKYTYRFSNGVSKTFTVKKGINIQVDGQAKKEISDMSSDFSGGQNTPQISSYAGTYTYTEPGTLWYKVKINADNTVQIWTALPSTGNWGDIQCQYESKYVFKHRGINDGKIYYQYPTPSSKNVICWLDIMYFTSTKQLALHIGENGYPKILVRGNRNPWE